VALNQDVEIVIKPHRDWNKRSGVAGILKQAARIADANGLLV
jgi:hypothetical protein